MDCLLRNKLTKILFAVSAAIFTGFQIKFSSYGINKTFAVVIVALNIISVFILTFIFAKKYRLPEDLFKVKSPKAALVSIIIAAYTSFEIVYIFYLRWYDSIITSQQTILVQMRNILSDNIFSLCFHIGLVLGYLAIVFFIFPFIFAVISRLKPFIIKKLWKNVDITEKIYALSAMLILGMFVTVAYIKSTVWYIGWDAVYSMDSHYTISGMSVGYGNSILNVRRFFLPLASYPFSITANGLARLFYFIPLVDIYVIQMFSILLMITGGILLSRMCAVEGITKVLMLLCYSVSYPFFVYAICSERYVIYTFYVLLLIYIYIYIITRVNLLSHKLQAARLRQTLSLFLL